MNTQNLISKIIENYPSILSAKDLQNPYDEIVAERILFKFWKDYELTKSKCEKLEGYKSNKEWEKYQ